MRFIDIPVDPTLSTKYLVPSRSPPWAYARPSSWGKQMPPSIVEYFLGFHAQSGTRDRLCAPIVLPYLHVDKVVNFSDLSFHGRRGGTWCIPPIKAHLITHLNGTHTHELVNYTSLSLSLSLSLSCPSGWIRSLDRLCTLFQKGENLWTIDDGVKINNWAIYFVHG